MLEKDSIHQKHITILNLCIPNKTYSIFTKQKWIELQGETDNSTITIDYFNIYHKINDRLSR